MRLSPNLRRPALLLVGIGLPALLALVFVDRYGVNVPVHDEWNFMTILKRFYAGGDWLPLVLEHYGEHRIVLPKMILLGLAPWIDYNVKVLMYLSVLAMALTVGFAWLLIRRDEALPDATIIPVGWLLLSTAQYENLLVGWQFQIPLMNLLVMGTVVVLAQGATLARQLVAGLLAFGATFSFANGLLVWPAAVPLVLAGERRGRWRRVAVWGSLTAVTAALYVWGYQGFDRPPAGYLGVALRQPLAAAGLFFGLVGGNFGWGSVAPSIVAGVLVTVWLLVAAAGIVRYDRWRRCDLPWLPLLAFAFLSTAAIVSGRSFAWQSFVTPSRYLTVTVFIPVVAVVWSVRVLAAAARRSARGRAPAVVAVPAVIVAIAALVSGWVTAELGWRVGVADASMKRVAVRCLLDYQQASTACLQQLYGPDGERVRRLARFLEAESLGPFADRQAVAEQLPRGSIDRVAGSDSRDGTVAAPVGEPLLVEGWALTDTLQQPAAVLVAVDGRWLAAGAIFLPRPDVEVALGRRLPDAGWRLEVPTVDLEPGPHRLSMLVLAPGSDQPVALPMDVTVDLQPAAAPGETQRLEREAA